MRFTALIVYGTTFACSLFFTHLAQRAAINGKRRKLKICSIIAIVIPCILAGLRAETVGTDTANYVNSLRVVVGGSMFSALKATTLEGGISFLAWLAGLTGMFKFTFLFLAQFMVIAPVFLVSYKNWKREGTSMSFVLFIYFCIFYGISLNVLGQSIAAALLLMGYQYYSDNEKVKCVLCFVLAVLFHSSAIIGIVMMSVFLYLSQNRKMSSLLRMVTVLLLVFFIMVLALQWENIIEFAIRNRILPQEYRFYLNIFSGENTYGRDYFFELSFINYLERAFLWIFLIFGLRIGQKKDRNRRLYFYNLSILTAALISWIGLLVFHTYYLYRITLTSEYLLLLLLPYLVRENRQRYIQKSSALKIPLRKLLISITVASYFLGVFIVYGQHGIIPYSISLM